jgi:sugar lactone lactonase YvrE
MRSAAIPSIATCASMSLVVGVTVLAMTATPASSSSAPNPYHRIDGWAHLSAGEKLSEVICVDVDANDNIWVFHRGTTPILKFDQSGKVIKGFGAGLFQEPHGMAIDSHGNIWVTDNGRGAPDAEGKPGKGHQVFEFSPEGKLLMTLGKAGVAGDGPDVFIAPTDVVVSPQGDIFVSDGHGDSKINYKSFARVMKFSKNGKFVKQWGGDGPGPGEFAGTHGIAMDSRGRIFVADRGNSRIQIFDQEGRFLDQWKQFGRPSGVAIDMNDMIYVADSESNDKTNPGFKKGLSIGSVKDGKVTAFLPNDLEPEVGFHTATSDSKGNLFVGAVIAKSLDKFVKQ